MFKEKSIQELALNFMENRTDLTFIKLYNRLKPGLRKFIFKYHKDPEVIDEIFAITLSKAYVHVNSYNSKWNFSTWIYKICQNECLMELRRQNSFVSLNSIMNNKTIFKPIRDDDLIEDVEYEFFCDEEDIQSEFEILEEIKNLPLQYRDVVSDRIVNKMKYKDIAEKYDLKIDTVKNRIHYAKKIIKRMWFNKKKKINRI